jgi:hypothetical protein
LFFNYLVVLSDSDHNFADLLNFLCPECETLSRRAISERREDPKYPAECSSPLIQITTPDDTKSQGDSWNWKHAIIRRIVDDRAQTEEEIVRAHYTLLAEVVTPIPRSSTQFTPFVSFQTT